MPKKSALESNNKARLELAEGESNRQESDVADDIVKSYQFRLHLGKCRTFDCKLKK